MGVLKAGRAHVALQPDRPEGYHSALLDYLQAETIFCDAEHLARAEALATRETPIQVLCLGRDTDQRPVYGPDVAIAPDDVAVISFTSGSTGDPKGVMRTHKALVHRHNLDQQLKPSYEDDRIAIIFGGSFGASQADIFGGLLSGGTICLYDIRRLGVAPLAEWINTTRLTRLHLPVELFRQWLETLAPATFFPTLREVAPAGRLYGRDIERARPHLHLDCQIITRFASNETGMITHMSVGAHSPLTDDVLPVGRPAPDLAITVVDETGQPVAPNADGEIIGEVIVSGRFLSSGYWRRPDLSAAAFDDDPDRPGWRRYRTGDWVRVRPDGILEFQGSRDERIKVRGFTVELSTVQAALANLPEVRNCAIIAQDTPDGDKRMVAFFVAHDTASPPTPAVLRRGLAQTLSNYMIPAAFAPLDALPLTPSNKIDRLTLLALAPSPTQRPDLPNGYLAPRTPTEAHLAGIWAEVLGIDAIGVHDNFLDLGGNSILAARIVARVVRDLSDQSITLATLLQAPTIAEMAAILPPRLAEAEQLAALVAEMEAIADDEAAALLGSLCSANAAVLFTPSPTIAFSPTNRKPPMRTQQRTAIFATLAILAVAALAAACTAPAPPATVPAAASPAPLTKIRILISPFLSYAPYYIAIEEGYFADEGLDVEVVRLEQSSEAVPILVQGDLDMAGPLAGAGMFNAIAHGSPIKIVAYRTYWAADGCANTGLLVRPDLVGGQELADAEHLKGRHLATNPVGPEGFYTERVLQDFGLKLEDMVVDDIPSSALIDALKNGSIDIANASEPWVTRIVQSGAGFLWKSANEVAPDFQVGVMLFGPTLLEKDRQLGERVMRAYLRGLRQYNEGKTERNLDIIAKATELDPELLKASCWPAMRSYGTMINADSLIEFQQWLVEKGHLDEAAPVEAF